MSEYRNRKGKRISDSEWTRRFADTNYRAVSNDLLDDGVQVSTFWVGAAEKNEVAGRQLFETLAFGGEHDHRKRTYSTLADAIRGHREIVDKLREDLAGKAQPNSDDSGFGYVASPNAREKSVRHAPTRAWVLEIVPILSARLRSDPRLEVIAGARLPSGDYTVQVDLLVQETRQARDIPRVAIQCVSGAATSREVRSFDDRAAALRRDNPSLRNGLLIRNVDHIPASVIEHGSHFDFIAVWNGALPPIERHCGLVMVLLDEVHSSRVIDSLISGRKDRKPCTLLHRPIFLPENQ